MKKFYSRVVCNRRGDRPFPKLMKYEGQATIFLMQDTKRGTAVTGEHAGSYYPEMQSNLKDFHGTVELGEE